MADSEDMNLLMSGEQDLSQCDFREADLSGMDLKGRDFTQSLLQKANCEGTQFDGSDFSGAEVSFIKASKAVFNRCKLSGLHFGYADLTNASLKNASAIGTRFQHTKLDKADLQGANFTNGAMDADTTLIGAISDEATNFEGLKVLRPTSRDPLFEGYIFKKGTLHRHAASSSTTRDYPSKEDAPQFPYISESRHSETVKKRSQVPPPDFPLTSAEISFDYTSHDGIALIGNGETVFETKWSNGDSSSMHIYNDPTGIRGVAVATGFSSIDDINPKIVAGLDFTSRARTIKEGEIAVVENNSGRFLAARVIKIRATSHGDSENLVTLRYKLIPTHDQDQQISEVLSLVKSAEDRLVSLRSEIDPIASQHGGIGHNNPPASTPLGVSEFEETMNSLKTIRREVSEDKADLEVLERSKNSLAEISNRIVTWIGGKFNLAVDEFAKQIGKTLGDTKFYAAAWLALSGALDQLVGAIGALLPF
nr:pentapeptide repeat-containing protein [uncultured Cohaesibacter sp.]